MKSDGLISVIIPVYNVKKYIEKCIRSILNQSYRKLEIIIIDDGSTDGSEVICEKLKNEDQRIILLHQENGGQSSARNKGLEIASGEYIGFVDADDWIDNNFFERLIKKSKKENLDMCVCNRRIFSEQGKVLYETGFILNRVYTIKDINEYFYNYFFQYTPVVYNRIYKRKVWEGIRFLDLKEIGTEDTLVNFEIMFRLKRIGEIDGVFYNNLEREGSTARSYRGGMLYQNLNLYQRCTEIIEKQTACDSNNAEVMCLYIYNFFQQRAWQYIRKYTIHDYESVLKRELLEIKKHPMLTKISLNMIFSRKLVFWLRKSGYRITGVYLIKILYFLQSCRFLRLEQKFISNFF